MKLTSVDIHSISHDVVNLLKPEIKKMVHDAIEQQDCVMSIEEVMKLFGKTRNAIHKKCRSGHLPYHKTEQGEYFFSKREIYKLLIKD